VSVCPPILIRPIARLELLNDQDKLQF